MKCGSLGGKWKYLSYGSSKRFTIKTTSDK
jgi:hypothetical protein